MYKCWSYTYSEFHEKYRTSLEFRYIILAQYPGINFQNDSLIKVEKQSLFYKYISKDILIDLKNGGFNALHIDPYHTTFYFKEIEKLEGGSLFNLYKIVCNGKIDNNIKGSYRTWSVEHRDWIIELLKEETMESIKMIAEELKDN
jgi:hypothetical protein